VFSCKIEDSVKVENATSRAALLTDLGYSVSDNLVSDLVILCEGPTDKVVLEEFLRKMGLTEQFVIRIWALGGDVMSQHDLSVFAQAYRIMALIDQDPKSSHVRKAFIENCNGRGIPVHQLKRYSIESYLSLTSIAKMTNQAAPSGLKELDPNQKVSTQLGYDIKGNMRKISKDMSLKDIEGTDLVEFLRKVEAALKTG